jgi:hypothetical protein
MQVDRLLACLGFIAQFASFPIIAASFPPHTKPNPQAKLQKMDWMRIYLGMDAASQLACLADLEFQQYMLACVVHI